MNEAKGTLVAVDKTLFIEVIRHLTENKLLDDFSDYLESEAVSEIVLDVNSANMLKKYLSSKNKDHEFSQMVIKCSCGGPTRPPRPSPIRG